MKKKQIMPSGGFKIKTVLSHVSLLIFVRQTAVICMIYIPHREVMHVFGNLSLLYTLRHHYVIT